MTKVDERKSLSKPREPTRIHVDIRDHKKHPQKTPKHETKSISLYESNENRDEQQVESLQIRVISTPRTDLCEQGKKESASEQSADIDLKISPKHTQDQSNEMLSILITPDIQNEDVNRFDEDNSAVQGLIKLSPQELKDHVIPSNVAQDILLERNHSDDSYNECFIIDVIFNEDMLMNSSQVHEETIASLRHEVDFDEYLKSFEANNRVSKALKHAPITIKPVISFLLSEVDKITPESKEEFKETDFMRKTINHSMELFDNL